MASSLRLVVSRHLRDSATASNVLVCVAMDQCQWINNTDGSVTWQEVDGIKALFPVHVDQVLKVPAHEVIRPSHGAGRHMAGIIGVLGSEDGLGHVSGGQLFHVVGHIEN